MRTSGQNTNAVRPTVEFFYIVDGWKDDHGKTHVETTRVYTNRRNAKRCFARILEVLPSHKDFVSMYTVKARTCRGVPEFVGSSRECVTSWGS